jgi:hypothetical protein
MKTNDYVATLPDLEVAKKVEQVQKLLLTVGDATTGEVVDQLFPHLSSEDKFRVAILVQIVMKNMRRIKA